jgi:hypothetical protein
MFETGIRSVCELLCEKIKGGFYTRLFIYCFNRGSFKGLKGFEKMKTFL